MRKKVLVCGSTGFIGRNITESLSKRDDLEIHGTYYKSEPINDPAIKMVRANLLNQSDVDRIIAHKDVIIQAAATTSGAKDIVSRPYHHVTDNAVMNSLIFRSGYEHNVPHVIFFSCSVMYQSSQIPVKETDFNANMEIHPKYFGVGWTKVYIEKMCEFYSRIGSAKYTVLRHSNIYGPYDKFDLERSHVFAATMTKVMTAENGKRIVVWGDGKEERDLLYVSDLVNFTELAIDQQTSKFEIYNVGSGWAISVNDLVRKIIAHSGKNTKIEYDPSKPNIKTKLSLDITKARNAMGWRPKVSIDEGIEKTMGWYKSNILRK